LTVVTCPATTCPVVRGRRLLAVCVVAASAPVAASAGSAPPGASARCTDGSYSFSTHRSGTCSHHRGVAAWLDGAAGGSSAATRVRLGPTLLLARRTGTSRCRLGALPDRRCSPGAYSGGLTSAVICASGFRTGTIRDVPQSEKAAVEREYGLEARPYGRTLEIDHIVPLELGGSNAVANLYPEPGGSAHGYRDKDRLENRLHALVCAGQIGLRDAQARIAANWRQFYATVFRLHRR
jgi:hypothetical protein